VFNLPAVFIVLAVTALLVRGTRESAATNFVMVGIKLAVLVFFIVIAFANFSTKNFTPFYPHGTESVTTAAAIIFFAYIGFDAVSTGSEEARNPKRDLPMAVIGSLVIVTIFYILTAVGAIGNPALSRPRATARSGLFGGRPLRPEWSYRPPTGGVIRRPKGILWWCGWNWSRWTVRAQRPGGNGRWRRSGPCWTGPPPVHPHQPYRLVLPGAAGRKGRQHDHRGGDG
jgi:hypothetical protein